MKKICLALAVISLSSCGYQKNGTSWAQTYDDFVGCHKQAQQQERDLENQCMVKLGYSKLDAQIKGHE